MGILANWIDNKPLEDVAAAEKRESDQQFVEYEFRAWSALYSQKLELLRQEGRIMDKLADTRQRLADVKERMAKHVQVVASELR